MSFKEQQDQIEPSGQFNAPKSPAKIPPSAQMEIDDALEALKANKNVWASLDIQKRINILDEITNDVQSVAERWINAGIEAQDLQANQYGIGEKHALFSLVYRIVRQEIRAAMGEPRLLGHRC